MSTTDAVTITSPGGETEATFHPDANLLCSSLRHRDAELLDPGRGVEAYARQGKTCGIPLLYPWANRLSHNGYAAAGRTVTLPEGSHPTDPNGLPIHGAMPGELRWQVTDHAGARLAATLDWTTGERLLALFPYPHTVTVEAEVSATSLTLTTTVVPQDGGRVPISFGYHPYLTLPGSDRRGWQVDLGAAQRLVTDARQIPTGEREPLTERDFLLGEHGWDDGLAQLASPAQFLVSDGELALAVTFEAGYDWAQVYAPPGQDVVCFEPMTAPTDALNRGEGLTVLEDGATYTARFSVAVRP